MWGKLVVASVLSVVFAVGGSSSAQAWTLSQSGAAFTVTDDVGVPDALSVEDGGAGQVAIRDPASAFAGAVPPACALTEDGDILCGAGTVGAVVANLSAGSDSASVALAIAVTFDGGDGDDVLTGGAVNDSLAGGPGNDVLDGGDGDDRLDGGVGGDALSGGAGADTLTGGSEEDQLDGGSGPDALDAGAGDDVLVGGSEGDSLLGGDGADQLDGGQGDDQLDGQNDGDIVDGGAGANVLKGAAGDDTITSSGQDSADGGPGADSLTASGGGAVFDGGDGDDVLQGAAGADTLRGGDGNDQLLGGDGGDRLDGGAGEDSLDGGLGLNAVAGGDGNDVITLSGSGGEQADGGAGDDQIAAGDAGARLQGGSGRDTLTGGAGPDALSGGADDDSLDGGDGADSLDGSDGADSLVGGLGPDVMAGGLGADRVSYADVSAGVTASLDDQANDGAAGEGDNVRSDVETLTGSPGDDRLLAGNGPATLQGAEGSDTLVGGPAGDTLSGGADDDLLDGGGGPDTIIGEDGSDTVSYTARANGVRVALGAGTPVSGELGEADLIDGSVENAQTGSGNDTVSGAAGVSNVVSTGAGADTLNFRDGDVFTDQLTCGDGLDNAKADATDVQGADCEKLQVAGKAVALNVAYTGASTVRVGSEGVVSITISCGSLATVRCSGSVLLRDSARKSIAKKTSFRVPAGQSKSVRVRILTERIKRLRRGAPRTRSITAQIDATDLGGRTARVTRKLKIAYRKTR